MINGVFAEPNILINSNKLNKYFNNCHQVSFIFYSYTPNKDVFGCHGGSGISVMAPTNCSYRKSLASES